ncbi:hypothetical protein Aph01nite_21810 [Acrocarpospora phusangensis]|uniref:Uncharacterized protein n=1 Tax=Acrocarpospora phusangensis TaxID=1070424 RepID=A0A919Q9B8_9ACTN|nr:hypothetical protein [Acrocarpospora phusangensis]GIH23871.1 hypothetical protein Aph01nite_21810 [Acrocarpospora phusangensis]
MSERELRALLVRATEDRPPGIDLLRAPRRRALRARILVPPIAALGVAAAVSLVALVVPLGQPSAQARVAAAVDNTTGESYRIHITAGPRAFEGAFDPVQGIGVLGEVGGGSETRFLGERMYVRPQPADRWYVQPRVDTDLNSVPATTALVKFAPLDPQAALARLRSATDVRESGTASGDGWTGERFAFTLNDVPGGKIEPHQLSGTVDVDDQGRVRRLDVTFSDDGQHNIMEIGDFGSPVTVTPPPADQVVDEKEVIGKKGGEPGGPQRDLKGGPGDEANGKPNDKAGETPNDKPTLLPGDPATKPADGEF